MKYCFLIYPCSVVKKIILLSIITLFVFTSCATSNKTQKGALYGAGGGAIAGALVGQLIGGDTEATLIGAAIGAAVGGASGAGIGRMMDNQERDMRQALANSEAAAVRREGDLLAITL
jgi:phage tail tape-measure protein